MSQSPWKLSSYYFSLLLPECNTQLCAHSPVFFVLLRLVCWWCFPLIIGIDWLFHFQYSCLVIFQNCNFLAELSPVCCASHLTCYHSGLHCWLSDLGPELISLLDSSTCLNPLWSCQTFWKVRFRIPFLAFLLLRDLGLRFWRHCGLLRSAILTCVFTLCVVFSAPPGMDVPFNLFSFILLPPLLFGSFIY